MEIKRSYVILNCKQITSLSFTEYLMNANIVRLFHTRVNEKEQETLGNTVLDCKGEKIMPCIISAFCTVARFSKN